MTDPENRTWRVVFSTDNLFGGTGTHIVRMTRYWDPSRWTPMFVSKARETVYPLDDLRVEFFPSPRFLDRYPFAQMHEVRFFSRYLAGKSPDIVHAYFFWPILYGRFLKYFGKIRLLVENREDQGFDWGRHEYALLNRTSFLPDRVICVSDAVRQEVLRKENLDPDRTLVIHNGVEIRQGDGQDRSAIRKSLGLGMDDLVVGYVGNYDRPVKGLSYFLEAIPMIVDEVPSARFLVVGKGGAEEKPMRAKAETLGIDRYVVFAGYQEDIHRYYSVMDVSALTSLSEGLSMTILESMVHKIPVVVTNVGGNPEVVVEGETGYLVPSGNIQSLVEKIVLLLKRPNLRIHMGQAGLRRAEDKFRLEDVANRYLGVYEDLIGSSSRRLRLNDGSAASRPRSERSGKMMHGH